MVPLMKFDRLLARSAGLFVLGLCASDLCHAQEPRQEEEEEMPAIQIPGLNAPDDPQQEMIRIFHEVERTLESIDIELFDASAGRIPMPEGKESGIERLLRSHGEKSDQAVAGIERILELAQQMGGKGGT